MTDTHNCHYHSPVLSTKNMKLASSASEQNVCFTYVCLVNDLQPTAFTPHRNQPDKTEDNELIQQEETPIKVERTKALHELIESSKKEALIWKESGMGPSTTCPIEVPSDESEPENEPNEFLSCDNPHILKLTKMKWLTEDHDSVRDSSSPSISPATSCTSSLSRNSECDMSKRDKIDDKYLSTILRLDKEHNMFGLSSIAIIGSRPSKQKRSSDEKAVFHQTAIVQICCEKGCCKNTSRTDLPTSLKCQGCKSCCRVDASCLPHCSIVSCPEPPPPCTDLCTSCPKGTCTCVAECPTAKSTCGACCGLKIRVHRRPKFNESRGIVLTPRASSVLSKPFAARICNHTPQCIPPSNCFPYLMPCYWPAPRAAPCCNPTYCFHNPPCHAPKPEPVRIPLQYQCPKHGKKCEDKAKGTTCTNEICWGRNESFKKFIEETFGHKK